MTPTTFDASAFLAKLDGLDAELVNAGFPATSPWWRAEIERVVRAVAAGGSRSLLRRWIIRAGRRGGKSSTLCRFAAAWALWGPWVVPSGDVGVIPFLSLNREEAAGRLRTIKEILQVLGVAFSERAETIELADRPVLFRVTTNSTDAVGFTAILVVADEVSRWESRDTASNPAKEVIGSISPALATQPFGFLVACSSPWSVADWHAEQFDKGDSAFQAVSFAPTWIANPSLTEEDTRALTSDLQEWKREYGAIPGAVSSPAFDPDDLAACWAPTKILRGSWPRGITGSYTRAFLLVDPSRGQHDRFAWARCSETDRGEIEIERINSFSADDAKAHRLTVEGIVNQICSRELVGPAKGITRAHGDNYIEALPAYFHRHGNVEYLAQTWSASSKANAVRIVRDLMRSGSLCIFPHAEMRRQASELQAQLSPSGVVKYDTGGQDYVALLLALGHAIAEGHVRAVSEPMQLTLAEATLPNLRRAQTRIAQLGTAVSGGQMRSFRPMMSSSFCSTHNSHACGCR